MSWQPRAVLVLVMTASSLSAFAQAVPSESANEARIDHLLSQMTLEEKMNLIRGNVEPAETNQGQAGYLPGVPRLSVPPLRFADGPPGVLTRIAGQAESATMAVAATWSRKDAEQNGIAIGRQARSLGIDVVLQPFINIDRDITFARSYNTLGEDPFLTGVMGAAEIRGEQSQGVMSQAKHYVGYDSDSYNVFIDPQTLHEVYVAPFDAAVRAGVASIMCSYNKLNGIFACGNPDTLKTILRDEIGFKGFITSDWGGVHNVHFLNQGLTMEMPGEVSSDSPFAGMIHTFFATKQQDPTAPTKPNEAALAGMLGGTIPEETKGGGMDLNAFPMDTDPATMRSALADESIKESDINAAARRVLYEIDRFGFLDGKQKHNITPQDVKANGDVIEKTAEDAAVLLKNDGGVLPLNPKHSLALIGPTAGQVASIGTFGERSPGIPDLQVGPLAALKQLAPNARITYAVNDDMTGTTIPASRFSHEDKPGLLRINGDGATSTDSALDFTKSNGKSLPPNTVATWKGTIQIASAGSYWFYLQLLGTRGILSIDGKEIGRSGAAKGTVHGDVQHASQDNGLPTTDGLDNIRRAVQLTPGKHTIEVVTSVDTSNAPVQIRLNWMTPEAREQAHRDALAAAKNADTAVVFVWTRDKPHFELPGDQDKLVEEIAGVNPNTIVVLNTSQPIAMPWIDKVKGVIEMWWPGDEGGIAEAKTLLGLNNPGGKLPVTWARSLTDYPATSPTHPERSSAGVGGKTTFSEGVLVGYRWFDDQNIAPLYPFGFGLSYSKFELSDLTTNAASDGGIDLTVKVKNTGTARGDEVPQAYLGAPADKPQGIQFAPRTLVAFDRLSLNPGEAQTVSLHVPLRAMQYWSESNKQWIKPNSPRTLFVGNSSRDTPLKVAVAAR